MERSNDNFYKMPDNTPKHLMNAEYDKIRFQACAVFKVPANARLIASAPKLLELLTEWERMIPKMFDETPTEGSLRARTLQAIQQARGEE